MNKFQLKRLIQEVLREVESEVEDPKTNTGSGKPEVDSDEAIPPHEIRKKRFGTSSPVLSLSLGGINKNNSSTLEDFIGMIAHAAGKLQLQVIHAELEKDGKIGLELDASEIKKSDAEINAELDRIAAQRGDEDMTPAERLAAIKPGERSAEWQAATEKDAEDNRKKTALKAAKIKAGTYDPNDTSLWTDKEWDAYDTGTASSTPNYKKSATVRGVRGAVSGDLTRNLRH